jgi:hypothetical protein
MQRDRINLLLDLALVPARLKEASLLAEPRSVTPALVQICLCDVNVAIDLPGLPQIPAPATDQSCAATSPANTLIGVACPHPAPWSANLHSARRSPRHRLPFPADSFIEGSRTPARVQAASLRSAGIRNPQQEQTYSGSVGISQRCPRADMPLRKIAVGPDG